MYNSSVAIATVPIIFVLLRISRLSISVFVIFVISFRLTAFFDLPGIIRSSGKKKQLLLINLRIRLILLFLSKLQIFGNLFIDLLYFDVQVVRSILILQYHPRSYRAYLIFIEITVVVQGASHIATYIIKDTLTS